MQNKEITIFTIVCLSGLILASTHSIINPGFIFSIGCVLLMTCFCWALTGYYHNKIVKEVDQQLDLHIKEEKVREWSEELKSSPGYQQPSETSPIDIAEHFDSFRTLMDHDSLKYLLMAEDFEFELFLSRVHSEHYDYLLGLCLAENKIHRAAMVRQAAENSGIGLEMIN